MAMSTMDEEARQGFWERCALFSGWVLAVVAGGLSRGLDDAPAGSGSAGRHTDVRGSGPHVGHAQEVAPD